MRYMMDSNDLAFLRNLFKVHVKFFTKTIPLTEEEFKWNYKNAHSDFWCIRKSIHQGLHGYYTTHSDSQAAR